MRATCLSLIVALAACGGETGFTSGGGDNSGGSSTDASPQTCTWPSNLDPTDAASQRPFGNGVCAAYLHFLTCTGPNGGGGCTVDDAGSPPECPNTPPSFGPLTCTDQCASNEFAVACSGLNTTPPDSSCRRVESDPESGFYCCPCVSGGS